MLAFLAAQIAALLAGVLFLAALGAVRMPVGLFLPASWLGGTGMLAVERLLLAQAGLQWNLINLVAPWLVVALIVAWRLRNTPLRFRLPRFAAKPGFLSAANILQAGIAIIIVLWTLTLFSRAIASPPIGWDSLVIWLFKGHVLYQTGTVSPSFFTDPYYSYAHLDYPLFVPLTVAQTYAWTGDNDMLIKGWWALLGGAAAAGLYYGLSGISGLAARLVGLVALIGLPIMAEYASGYFAGYAELPLAICFLFGAIFLYRWLKLPAGNDYIPAVLFLSLAGFTKNEGLVVSAVGVLLVLAIGLARRRLSWAGVLVTLLLAGLIVVPWQVELRLLGLQSDLSISLSGMVANWPTRIWPIMQSLSANALSIDQLGPAWLFLLPLSALALFYARRRWLPTLALLALVGVHMAASVAAYLVTPYDLTWHLTTSAARVVFQSTLPVLLLGTIYLDSLVSLRDHAKIEDTVEVRDLHYSSVSSTLAEEGA